MSEQENCSDKSVLTYCFIYIVSLCFGADDTLQNTHG